MAEHTKLILVAVSNERAAQDAKWGEQNHRDSVWMAILAEEVGEAAKAVLEGKDLEKELIQVAAVAVAWHESRWRGKKCGCKLCLEAQCNPTEQCGAVRRRDGFIARCRLPANHQGLHFDTYGPSRVEWGS